MKTIIILIFAVAVLVIFFNMLNYPVEGFDGEGFLWDPLWVGKKSNDCYSLNNRDCMKYSNCGLCDQFGRLECVPGDEQGPLFKDNCSQWIHTNYYDRHIFGEKVVTATPSWSQFYPEYELRYPSPTSRATL